MRTETHNETIVDALNHLITTNRDSENGYWTAAEGVKDETLHTLFHRYAQQRGRFAAELEQEVRTYGGEPAEGGTMGGTLRRGWLNIKAAVTGGRRSSILAECDRSEMAALENYRDALQEDLPEYLKETIREQHDEIQEALQHIRALKEAANEE